MPARIDDGDRTHQPMEADMSTPVIQTPISPALKDLWQRAHRGWPASYPLVQFPSLPLIVAVSGLIVAMLTSGSAHDYAQAAFYGALGVWAWLEGTSGVNWPHRVLGAAGFVYVVVHVAQALGA